jgi:hypothetical protein
MVDFGSECVKWGDIGISYARTTTEIDLLIKHAAAVLYIFHATILYYKSSKPTCSTFFFLNSPTCFGLTYQSYSGSLLWHVHCIFQLISYNFHKGLSCVYSSQNGSCAMYEECRNNNIILLVINRGNIQRQRGIKELQKMVILGISYPHILLPEDPS